MKKGIFYLILLALFFSLAVTVCHASSGVLELFDTYEADDFSEYDLRVTATTAELGWTRDDGQSLKRTTYKGLSGYVLSSDADGGKLSFVTSFAKSLDVYEYKKLYFALFADGGGGDCSFEITLKMPYDDVSYGGKIKTGKWNLISLDTAFIGGRDELTAVSLSTSGDDLEAVSFSGPYVRNSDKIYENVLFSSDFAAVGTELEYIGRGTKSETLSFALSPQRIVVTGKPSVTHDKFDCNAIRIVMSNNSEYKSMEFGYTYFDAQSGKYRSVTQSIALDAGSAHFSYLTDTVKVGLISGFSLVFDEVGTGSVTIEKIEPVNVYPKKEDTSCGFISGCRTDPAKTKVTLTGKINHNFLIMHDNYTLACYAIGISETLDGVISGGARPVSTCQMSSEFRFDIKAGKLDGSLMTKRFAVAAVSPEGDVIPVTSPVFTDASFGVPATSSGRTNIKGIESHLALGLTDSGLGYAIVDLRLDRLVNGKNSGILCSAGDEYIFFDSSYIDELDREIKNLYASGAEVLLRLLVSADADPDVIPYADVNGKTEESEFLAINASEKRAEAHFSATVDFIAKRYSGVKNGKISGFVLGKSLDMRNKYFASSAPDYYTYAKQVAEDMEIMAHVCSVIPDVQIFLPISEHRYEGAGTLDSELFLTSVCRIFDESGGLTFSLILEGTSVPYGLTGGVKSRRGEESDVYGTDNIYVFERLLDYLAKLSSSAPGAYIYTWNPDLENIGNALLPAYVYNYYSIMFSDRAGAFILSPGDGDKARKALEELNYLMKYIDTERNSKGELCKASLGAFGASSWSDIINGYNEELLVHRAYFETDPLDEIPPEVKGKYAAFDFSGALGVLDWFCGAGCRSVTVSSMSKDGKSLHATMERGNDAIYSYADIVYKFEYPENAEYISHMSFDLTAGSADDGAIYEIMVLLSGEGSELAAKKVTVGGERAQIIIDLTENEIFSVISSIRICVRCLSEDTSDDHFDLYLRSVEYLSEGYGSAELRANIMSSRARAKNQLAPKNEDGTKKTHTEIIIIAVLVIAVSVGMAAFADRRHTDGKK